MRVRVTFCSGVLIVLVSYGICTVPDGYNNDCYQLINTENALSSKSQPIEYICKKADEYHHVNVRNKETDIRNRFSKRQVKITFMYNGLIRTLIKKNSFEEWGSQNFTFDSPAEAVKFYLEVEPTDNPRIKLVSSIRAIHVFVDRDGTNHSRSSTIPIAHRAAAYYERFVSHTIITIKSAKRNGLQKPLFVFSNENFALSQTDGNNLTLSIEGQDKFFIFTFDDDKQALQFYDEFVMFANTKSKIPTPRDLIDNERNCFVVEKIEPALRTESKGVTRICSTTEGWNIISVMGRNEEILLEVTESQNRIVFLNDSLVKFVIKRNSDQEWWPLSCTFKLANDATGFYLGTELGPQNNHRMKFAYEVKQVQKLVKCARRKPKLHLCTIAKRTYFYEERFNSWTIITGRSHERYGNGKPLFVFSGKDFTLSKVIDKSVVLFVDGNDDLRYILRFDNKKQADGFREFFKIFASTESEREIPNDIKIHVSNKSNAN